MRDLFATPNSDWRDLLLRIDRDSRSFTITNTNHEHDLAAS